MSRIPVPIDQLFDSQGNPVVPVYDLARNKSQKIRLDGGGGLVGDSNPLPVVSNLAPGLLSCQRTITVIGHDTIGNTREVVTNTPGTYAGFLDPSVYTGGTAIRVKAGGNAADTAAGTGARSVIVDCLLIDGRRKIVSLTTNGGAAGPSSAETNVIRAIRATVDSVGTYHGSNAGDIVIETVTTPVDLLQIDTGVGDSEHGGFVVPADETAYIAPPFLNVDQDKSASFFFNYSLDILNTTAPYGPTLQTSRWIDLTEFTSVFTPVLFSAPPLTDVWMECLGPTPAAEITAGLQVVFTKC